MYANGFKGSVCSGFTSQRSSVWLCAQTFMTAKSWGCFPSDGKNDRRWAARNTACKFKEVPALAAVLFLFSQMSTHGRWATGTCRWWGNQTPPWWGVVPSSACVQQVWGDSQSWAAAQQWWWGRESEEGSHLRGVTKAKWKIREKMTRTKEQKVHTDLNHTWLWYWMPSHPWKRFGYGRVALGPAQGHLWGSFEGRYVKMIQFWNACIWINFSWNTLRIYQSQSVWWLEEPQSLVWKLDPWNKKKNYLIIWI